MPLTAQQSRYILTQEGYDPDKYDVDENGNVSDKISEPNPSGVSPIVKNDPGISVSETAKRGITQSILPTLGSIAGGAAVGSLFAPGVGSVLGGIGGALAGGYGAGKLQEAIVPQQVQQDYFLRPEDVQTNPVTSAVSQFAPSALAFNPVKGVTSLAGALRRVPQGIINPSALRDIDVTALKNAALGAGIGGGVDLGVQATGDQPFNLPQFLTSTVGGGILNSPYKNPVNRALGLHPIPEDAVSRTGVVPDISPIEGLPNQNEINQTKIQELELLKQRALQANQDQLNQNAGIPSGTSRFGYGQESPQFLAKEDAKAQGGFQEPQVNEVPPPQTQTKPKGLIQGLDREEFQNLINRRKDEQRAKNELKAEEARIEDLKNATQLEEQAKQDRVEAYIKSSPYADNPEAVRVMRETLATHPNPLEDPITTQIAESRAKEIVSPTYDAFLERQRIKNEGIANKAAGELSVQEPIKQQPGENAISAMEERNRRRDVRYSLTDEQRKILDETGLEYVKRPDGILELKRKSIVPPPVTSKDLNQAQINLANRRGVAIENLPSLPPGIKGAEHYPSRQVKINPASATEGTVGHEVVGHTFLNDLLNSTNPRNVKLAQDAINYASDYGYNDANEFLADVLGNKVNERLNAPKDVVSRFKQWVNDAKTVYKYRAGDKSLASDVISMRALSDAPFGTRKDIYNESSKASIPRTPTGIGGSEASKFGGSEQTKQEPNIDQGSSKTVNADQRIEGGTGKDLGETTTPIQQRPGGTTETSEPVREDNSSTTTGKGGSVDTTTGKQEITPKDEISPVKDTKAGDIRYSVKKPGDQPETPHTRGVPGIRAELDAIRSDKELGAKAEPAFKVLTHLDEATTRNRGLLHDSFIYDLRTSLGLDLSQGNILEYAKGNNKTADRVLQYVDDINDFGKSNIQLNSNEKSIADKIRKHTDFLGSERNRREGLRQGGLDPTYFEQNISDKAYDTLTNRPGSEQFNTLHKDYVNHVADQMVRKGDASDLAQGRKAAESFWNGMLETFRDPNSKANIAEQFGAIDKAEGYGLPKSMRENNLIRRISKFSDRYARRLAYYDAIESNPTAMDALFGNEGIAGAKKVKTVLNRLTGVRSNFDLGVEAVSGIYNSMIMGTFAGVRDVSTTPVLGAQHQTLFQPILATIHTLTHLNENWKEALKHGLTPYHIGTLESNDGLAGYAGVTNLARRTRDISNAVQGRNFFERLARTMAYGIGKFTVVDNINTLKRRGNLTGQRAKFMDDFGPANWRTRKFTEDLSQETAARFAESVQGSYGPKGLPSIVTDSHLAPFLALSRWNIEKFNNFVKYSIDPATKGNFTPLLNQTAYLLLGGGAAIEALNELINKKKSKLPTVGEIQKTRDIGGDYKLAAAYKLAGLASISAYAGELGNLSKNLLDYHFGSRPRWYQYPVLEATTRGYQYLPYLAEAIAEKDLHKFSEIVSDMAESNAQTYRVLLRQASKGKQDELLHQDENRDLKLFKTLMGYPTGEIPSDNVEDYDKLYAREYHQADTADEIKDTLPKALKETINRSKTPEEIKNNLRGLKLSGGRTFPDLDTRPIEASKYLRFLGDAKGKERFIEDLKRKELNKVKSSLVPNF